MNCVALNGRWSREPVRNHLRQAKVTTADLDHIDDLTDELADANKRIKELEAALRPAIERCQCQKRVLLDAWIPCEACREAAALLDPEAKP